MTRCIAYTLSKNRCQRAAKSEGLCTQHLQKRTKVFPTCGFISSKGIRCDHATQEKESLCPKHARAVEKCHYTTNTGRQCSRRARENFLCKQHLNVVVKCAAPTNKGTKCRYRAIEGSDVCARHFKKAASVRARAPVADKRPPRDGTPLTYDELTVITQTIIVSTNLLIDNQKLFNAIECAPITLPPKTKIAAYPIESLADGDIVFVEFKGDYKGIPFKHKRKEDHMLNCITFIMKLTVGEPKYYNIKISNRGNIQVTGCKTDEPAKLALQHLWGIIRPLTDAWSMEAGVSAVTAYMMPVMCNVRIILPFEIDRQTLHSLVLTETNYISLLETSAGYVGVNIKIGSDAEPIQRMAIKKLCFAGSRLIQSEVLYEEYLNTLGARIRQKKLDKQHLNTFLTFHSGKIIMSGCASLANRRHSYDLFIQMIEKFRARIEVTTKS